MHFHSSDANARMKIAIYSLLNMSCHNTVAVYSHSSQIIYI